MKELFGSLDALMALGRCIKSIGKYIAEIVIGTSQLK